MCATMYFINMFTNTFQNMTITASIITLYSYQYIRISLKLIHSCSSGISIHLHRGSIKDRVHDDHNIRCSPTV